MTLNVFSANRKPSAVLSQAVVAKYLVTYPVKLLTAYVS